MTANMELHTDAGTKTARAGFDIWKRLVLRQLQKLERGCVALTHGEETLNFGSGSPVARLVVNDPTFFRKVALGGSVGAGEAYVAGMWDCDDLVALVRIFSLNAGALGGLDGARTGSSQLRDWLGHLWRRNSVSGSKRNIMAHYDLSNEFFASFLDSKMMYSSAVFESEGQALEAASTAKLDRLCQKLELGPEDHLLEIGTGWGGLAVHAARNFGCRVTTTTISPAQHRFAAQRVIEAGLQDRVDVLLEDYRNLEGRFDKVVSVEMVEAVGHEYLPVYFSTLNDLVREDGLIVLQAITIEDRRYRRALNSVDFIKKHIFPGSFIPCVSVLVSAAAKHTDAVLVNLEDIGLDYAWTLAAWSERLEANQDRIIELGLDDTLLRTWRFYLAYCEGGFRERAISDVQVVFAKPGYRGRPWRAAMGAGSTDKGP